MTLRQKTISGFKWTGFSQVAKQLILVCRNRFSSCVQSISLADLPGHSECARTCWYRGKRSLLAVRVWLIPSVASGLGMSRPQDPLSSARFLICSAGRESDQQSLFSVVARRQVHWLALSADEQDFGAVGIKDNLGVFIQIYTHFWTVPSIRYAN